jgi:hypothetical protein
MPKAAIEAELLIVKPIFEIPEEIVRMSEVKCNGNDMAAYKSDFLQEVYECLDIYNQSFVIWKTETLLQLMKFS